MLTATSNEHHSRLFRMKEKLGNELKVNKKPLAAGDYIMDAHGKLICFELKWSLGDLLDSCKTAGENGGPRLAIEVRKMLDFADIPILIVPALRARGDGKLWREDGNDVTGWDYASVKGILSSVQLYGVIVDEYDGYLYYRLAQWYYTLSNKSHSWIAQRGRPDFINLDPTVTEAIWALCSIDKVGVVTARALLKQFGSLRGVLNASSKDLQKVKDVGPIVAASILRVGNSG